MTVIESIMPVGSLMEPGMRQSLPRRLGHPAPHWRDGVAQLCALNLPLTLLLSPLGELLGSLFSCAQVSLRVERTPRDAARTLLCYARSRPDEPGPQANAHAAQSTGMPMRRLQIPLGRLAGNALTLILEREPTAAAFATVDVFHAYALRDALSSLLLRALPTTTTDLGDARVGWALVSSQGVAIQTCPSAQRFISWLDSGVDREAQQQWQRLLTASTSARALTAQVEFHSLFGSFRIHNRCMLDAHAQTTTLITIEHRVPADIDHALTLNRLPLSPRQREIALCVTRGWSGPRMAAHFGLSRHTIDGAVKDILHKLGLPSRQGLRSHLRAHHHMPALRGMHGL